MHLDQKEKGSPSATLASPETVQIRDSNHPQYSESEPDDVWATRVYNPHITYPEQEADNAAWAAMCDEFQKELSQ
jgi:hypothetical protein